MNGLDKDYKDWIQEVKAKIRATQLKAAVTVNRALIEFYWELGKMIAEKQTTSNWGDKIIEQVAKDLRSEFPDMKGLSRSNLFYAKQFYLFYKNEIVQQPVEQLGKQPITRIPWGHNIMIFTKSESLEEAYFYVQQTLENNWSRDVLAFQLKSALYQRHGKAITNFPDTLPAPQSDLANQTLKDPYIFDFLTFAQPYKEKDIENQLVQHVTKFLLELGKGFAFIGQQYHLEIGDQDYYLDLLFYHVTLKCYVVIELKNTRFIPEYAGKMNFYLSAVDSILKKDDDQPTIGIILCRDKNNIEAEFALRGINKPMGISEFKLIETLPEELKSSLPTIEEIEKELNKNE